MTKIVFETANEYLSARNGRGASVDWVSGFNACRNAAIKAANAATQAPRAVPAEVMAALDRMCTPLHESHLKGATAEADARCMKVIRDYILRSENENG